jgi:hypothetical protein
MPRRHCTKLRYLPIDRAESNVTNDVTYRERYAMVLMVSWMALSSGTLAYVMFGDWARQIGRALLP